MNDKSHYSADQLKADAWGQHLHEIDLMTRDVDDSTARYLARFKQGIGLHKTLPTEKPLEAHITAAESNLDYRK
jgi:hypothetical protein